MIYTLGDLSMSTTLGADGLKEQQYIIGSIPTRFVRIFGESEEATLFVELEGEFPLYLYKVFIAETYLLKYAVVRWLVARGNKVLFPSNYKEGLFLYWFEDYEEALKYYEEKNKRVRRRKYKV